jgi:biopolymer transport protein ExbD
MADVAFLLLIFIMLTALINYHREVKIDYPEARGAPSAGAEKKREIWVDRNGGLYLDGIPASLRDLEDTAAELLRRAPDTRLHIIADRNTPYEKINPVLEVLQMLQYRVVRFVVREP